MMFIKDWTLIRILVLLGRLRGTWFALLDSTMRLKKKIFRIHLESMDQSEVFT